MLLPCPNVRPALGRLIEAQNTSVLEEERGDPLVDEFRQSGVARDGQGAALDAPLSKAFVLQTKVVAISFESRGERRILVEYLMPDALLPSAIMTEDLGAQRMPLPRIVEPLYGTEQAVRAMRRTEIRVVVYKQGHLVGRPG